MGLLQGRIHRAGDASGHGKQPGGWRLGGRAASRCRPIAFLCLLLLSATAWAQPQLDLTPEEQTWLAEHPLIRVASDPAWYPIEYLDAQGEFVGIAQDYLKLLEQRLGVRLEVATGLTWRQAVEAMQRRELDLYSAVHKTPDRLGYVDFLEPYQGSHLAIFGPISGAYIGSLSALKGKRVLAVSGYASEEVLRRDHPEIQWISADTEEQALLRLNAGEAEALVGYLLSGGYSISRLGLRNLGIVGETDYDLRFGLAVRNDWPLLRPILQKALDSISLAERDAIRNRWSQVEFVHSTSLRVLLPWIGGLSTAFLLILFWVLRGNRQLRGEIGHRKEVERALGLANLIVEQSPAVLFRWRASEGWPVELVSSNVRQFGYEAKDLLAGKPSFAGMVHADDINRVAQEVQAYSAAGADQFSQEYRLVSPAGEVFWVDDRTTIERDADGQITAYQGVVVDISERKQAEAALSASQGKFEGLVNDIGDKFVIFSYLYPTGEVLYASKGTYTVFGVTREEVVGKPWQDQANWLPGEIEQAYVLDLQMAEEGVNFQEVEMRFIHPDGNERTIHVSNHPVRDPSGRILTIDGILEDVTERRAQEQTLRLANRNLQLNENRLNTMLALSEAAPRLSEQELLQLVLDQAECLTGSEVGYLHFVAEDQETTQPYAWSRNTLNRCQAGYEAHYPVSQAGIWADTVRTHQPVIHNDYPGVTEGKACPEGHVALTRHMAAPILDRGKVRLVLGVGNKHDPYNDLDLRQLQLIGDSLWKILSLRRMMSELAQARDLAESASRAKSAFLANMTHELRTPLNAILGYAQVLLMDDTLSAAQREDVETILGGGDHLHHLINEVLDLAKVESGKLKLEPAPFDPRELCEEVLSLLRVRANNRVRLMGEYLDLPQRVLGDKGRLRQVLLNLIGNAIKFTEQGQVLLRVTGDCEPGADLPARIGFAVADSGPGIPAEAIDTVMRPFEQAVGDGQAESGCGLGLSISASLVTLMGGRLMLGSRTAGGPWAATTPELPPLSLERQGTLAWFTLELPQVGAYPTALGGDRRIVGIEGRARDILIVDDSASNRAVLSQMLRPLGCQTREAEDADAALAMMRSSKPDLLITDLRMPVMDGYQLIHRVRQDPELRDIRILAISAIPVDRGQGMSANTGSDAFLVKPFKWRDLYGSLEALLGLHWRYASDGQGPQNPGRGIALPGRGVLERLRGQTDAGRVLELKASCDGLASQYPAFAALARRYVDEFRLDELNLYLQDLLGERDE